ncbi:hypothetical protein CFP56_029028 [Quercus suber]|uniref:Uncharacterized protein n=1 Tax=Quercus suber TaxID=58331 RepID=A0AAW0JTM5_QUESU
MGGFDGVLDGMASLAVWPGMVTIQSSATEPVQGRLCCYRFFEDLGKTQTEKWGEEETKIEKWVGKTKFQSRK